jgi:threonine dehydrogenase-like Zn-dependent dehydrogenase
MRAIYFERNIPRVLATKFIAPYWPGFVWTPLSSVSAVTFPDPPLPGPNWIRVRNRLCGICASDLSILFANGSPSIAPIVTPPYQRIYLGHEVVSTVVETGLAVTRFRVGDRVIMDSRFAGANCTTLGIEPKCRHCAGGEPYFCLNKSAPGPRGAGGGFGDGYTAHESEVYPCPPDLSDDQAVLVEPMSCAVRAVLRHPPEPGERVLVVGAGIIGLCVGMAAKAIQPECQLTVMARYPHQAEMALRLGADYVLSGREGYEGVAKHLGGKYVSAPLNKGLVVGGFDVIYDCVGVGATIEDSLRWTRAGGAVVVVGVNLAPIHVDLTPVWYRHINLIGTYEHGYDTWQGRKRHTYEWVIDFLRNGKFSIAGLITHRFPFDDYKRAIMVSMAKAKERPIKVLLEFI